MKFTSCVSLVGAALCCAMLVGPLSAEELLINADFSKKRANGSASNWNMLNGTTETAVPGVMTVENPKGKVTFTQSFRPQPGKRVLFSVELKCSVPGKVRAYVECEYERGGKKAGFNTGSAWKEAKAGEWMTLSGELPALPADYQKCYLAVWNDSGKPMEIRAPHAETADPVWLPNADFRQKNGSRIAKWDYRGKAADSLVFNGNAVKFADGILIQLRLPLEMEKNYRLSFAMRGAPASQGRAYVEWNKRDPNGKSVWGGHCTTGWIKTAEEWKNYTLTVKIPAGSEPPYLVLGAKDSAAVEFKDLKLEAVR